MFPIWLILGTFTILAGIFNEKIMKQLGFKPNSEVFTIPSRKVSSRRIEQIAQWLMITLGISFLILGLGKVLPVVISNTILFALLGLAGLMFLAIVGVMVVNWKAR